MNRKLFNLRHLSVSILVLSASLAGSVGLKGAEPAPAPEKKPTQEELQKMTPEERRAKLKALREKNEQSLTPEQKEARRKVVRERMQKQIDELKKKEADGTISEAERQKLELWQLRLKRLDTAGKEIPPAKPEDKPGDKPGKQ
jgi:hypothetical protein